MAAARIAGVAAHLPDELLTSGDVEREIAAAGGYRPRPGLIAAVSGISGRHRAPDDWDASDLAVAAARKLLAEQGLEAGELDLLIFASASQDMIEPATAHIVAAKLGARCPVFDVKNACNSVLNAVQIVDALIAAGQYRRVLVCTGEKPSAAIRWRPRDRAQFVEAFPGYTLSDGGSAVLMVPGGRGTGVFHRAFSADSRAWDVGTLPGGGTAHPRDDEFSYFRMDGTRLKRAFEGLGRGLLDAALAAHRLAWEDFALVCVHQVTMPFLRAFCERAGVPQDRLVLTLPAHGNLASVTLPCQLSEAVAVGRCGPGDRVALIGLAGGVSLGVVFVTL